jgi:hypothetical protein
MSNRTQLLDQSMTGPADKKLEAGNSVYVASIVDLSSQKKAE